MANKELKEKMMFLMTDLNDSMIGAAAIESYYRNKNKPRTSGYKPAGPGAYSESTYEMLAKKLTYEDIDRILEIKKRKENEKFNPDKRI